MRHHYTQSDDCTQFAILERVASLYHATLIEPQEAYVSWGSKPLIPAELSSSYGDWRKIGDLDQINPSKVFIIPGYCGGSDYSGDLVEVSNYKALIDMLPSEYEDGIDYITYSGGHGTFDIAIRLDRLDSDLLDAIEGLEDYPLIDESLHSELEMESQNEAWESDIRSEFKTALGKFMFSTWESSSKADQREDESDEQYNERLQATEEFLEDECGELTDSDLSELFWKMADLANEYWSNKQGSDSWINVDRVIKNSIGRNLNAPDTWKGSGDYHKKAYGEICAMIQDSMSDTKYDLGIVRYVDPNQMQFTFTLEIQ